MENKKVLVIGGFSTKISKEILTLAERKDISDLKISDIHQVVKEMTRPYKLIKEKIIQQDHRPIKKGGNKQKNRYYHGKKQN